VRCVVFRGVGGSEVVGVETRPDPLPSKFEVLIAPRFAGVNPADALQREGRHPVPPGWPTDVPGVEVAGPIIGCGEAVTAFRTGDRAFGVVGGGGLADRVIAFERELVHVPESLDDQLAAAVPEAFLTAFDALVLQARLAAGDTVLVNGANGGVGTAAIQIASVLGATVFASVRSEALRPRVAELGAIVASADEAVERVRSQGGADIVLELVGATHMPGNLAALAKRGRLVVVGARPGDEATFLLRDVMTQRVHVIGTTLRNRPPEEKASLAQEFGRRIVPLLAAGSISPVVDRIFPLEQAAHAIDYVRERAPRAPTVGGRLIGFAARRNRRPRVDRAYPRAGSRCIGGR
jgi:NADPH:quinone reductase-like Zn-dependent oxidoreductase